ncbi:MAG: radical SAM protein [Elusimicrobia bacterium]|nr:radical SAM protein [Elusimicrobiota bacterium]
MKAILINPISYIAMTSRTFIRTVTPVPCLGLAYLATILKEEGYEAFVEDQYASGISNEELVQKIKDFGADIVGFSCLTTAMTTVEDAIQLLKKELPDVTIILGDIHVTLFPEEVLRKTEADIVVRGEGEETLRELARLLKKGDSIAGVKGISYRDGDEVIHNPDRPLIENLDDLPFPDWSLVNLDYYESYPSLGVYGHVLPVQASRGCPYNCYYCSQDRFYKKTRYRDLSKVLDEMEYLVEVFGVKCIGFNDAYFPYSDETAEEFCDGMISRGLHKKITWFTELRVDVGSFKLYKKMKEANVCLVMFGIESGNQKVLDSMRKGTTLQQARDATRYCDILRIKCMGLFMLGVPGETRETCWDTINFAKSLRLDIAKFNVAIPYPGSSFFDDFAKSFEHIDELKDKFSSWYDWSVDDGEIIYAPEGMGRRELVRLQRTAMISFYLRPSLIIRTLMRMTFSLRDLFYGGMLLLKQNILPVGRKKD